jgi:hypothetical protein
MKCPYCDGATREDVHHPNVLICINPCCDAMGEMVVYRRVTIEDVFPGEGEAPHSSIDAAIEDASPHLAALIGGTSDNLAEVKNRKLRDLNAA